MIPSTDRVPDSTSSELNRRIEAQIAECIRRHALRRLGFRTEQESDIERNALKALRSDMA